MSGYPHDPWEHDPGTIYLICFDAPLGDPSRPRMSAQHYVGWTTNLKGRLKAHKAGKGSKIMAELKRRNIGWAMVWATTGTRNDERRLKKNGHFDRLCPVCKERKCA